MKSTAGSSADLYKQLILVAGTSLHRRGCNMFYTLLIFLFLFVNSLFAQGRALEVAPSGKPFTTITSALASAVAGDSIVVFPGTYTEIINLKNRVNLFFYPGSRVVGEAFSASRSTIVGNYLLSDSGRPVQCAIRGNGVFILGGVSNDSKGSTTIWIVSDSSTVYFEADTVLNTMIKGAYQLGSGMVNQGTLTANVKYLSARLYAGILVGIRYDVIGKIGGNLTYLGDEIYMDTTENIHRRSAIDIATAAYGRVNVKVRKILAGNFGVTFTRGGNVYVEADEIYAKGMCAFNAMVYGTGKLKARRMVLLPSNYTNSPVFTNYPAGSGFGNNSIFTLECNVIHNTQTASGESNHYAVKLNAGRLTVIADSIISNRKFNNVIDSSAGHAVLAGCDISSGAHPDTSVITINGAYIKYANSTRAPIYVGRSRLILNNCFIPTDAKYSIVSSNELEYPQQVRVELNNTRSNAPLLPTITQVQGNIILVPHPPVQVLPVRNSVVSSRTVSLVWNRVPNAQYYFVKVCSDSLMTNTVFLDTALTDTLVVLPHLPYERNYYWVTKVTVNGEVSALSNIFRFYRRTPPAPAPQLLAPANNSANVLPGVRLVWTKSYLTPADSFLVKLSGDSLFAGQTLRIITRDTVVAIDSLISGFTYYWRVTAYNSTGTEGPSEVFRFTSKALPRQPVLLSPLNGATGIYPGVVTLRWIIIDTLNISPVYNVQVFTDTVSAPPVLDSLLYSDSLLVQTVEKKEYFWRVRVKNEMGFGKYSEFKRFVTSRLRPSAPVPIAPVAGVNNVVNPVLFAWQTESRSLRYNIKVTGASGILADSIVTDTVLQLNLPYNSGVLHWSVAGINEAGRGEFASPLSFSMLTFPQAPQLLLPASGTNSIVNPVVFVWKAGVFTRQYNIKVTGASGILADSIVADTVLQLNLPYNSGVLHWSVAGINEAGRGEFASPLSFSMLTFPQAPQLLLPAAGTNNIVNPVRFVWKSGSFSQRYIIKVTGASGILADSIVADTVLQLSLPYNSGSLQWSVAGINEAGRGAFSSPVSFGMLTPASVPQPLLPVNNATALRRDALTFVWNKSYPDTLLKYSFILLEGEDTVYRRTELNDTLFVLPLQLKYFINYRWKVASVNPAGSSLFSAAFVFRTIDTLPGKARLFSPANNARNISGLLTFVWNRVPRVNSYKLFISENDTTGFTEVTTTADTLFLYSGVLPDTKYYWKVVTTGEGGTNQSVAFSFYTFGFPAQVIPATPVNGSLLRAPVLFAWFKVKENAAKRGVQYRFVTSADSLFQPASVIHDSLLADTSITITSLLQPGKKYYWKVQAINDLGTGVFSPARFIELYPLPPATPRLLLPADSSRDLLTPVTLVWSDTNATVFTVKVFSANDSVAFITDTNVTQKNYLFSSGVAGQSYRWSVTGRNTGGSSPASPQFMFTLLAIPTPPVQFLPVNNATRVGIRSVKFAWNRIPGVNVKYIFELSADTLAAPVYRDTLVIDTSITIAATLLNAQRYFWRIAAVNPAGRGVFSPRFGFTTIAAAPAAPSGLNASINTNTKAVLRWQDNATNEIGYVIERKTGDTSSAAGYGVIGLLPANSVSFTDTSVVAGVRYSWSVTAAGPDSLFARSNQVSLVILPLGIEKDNLPTEYSLGMNYPNPFNAGTIVRIGIKDPGAVKLTVVAVGGETVAVPIDRFMQAGFYTININSGNLPSGVYYLILKAGGKTLHRKILLLK